MGLPYLGGGDDFGLDFTLGSGVVPHGILQEGPEGQVESDLGSLDGLDGMEATGANAHVMCSL